MAIHVSIINGMGSGEDGNGDPLQNIVGASDSDFMHFGNVFIEGAGVADFLNDDLKVIENGTPDDTVDVSIGGVFIENTNGQMNTKNTRFWYVYSDTVENVEIAANTSGNPRIDTIIVTVDTVNPPGEEGELAGTIEVVQGTPNAVPTVPATPDNSYVLAEVLVENSFTTIENADITDTRDQAYISGAKVRSLELGGWQRVNDTWLYATSSTITVPSGAASIYSVGDKIKLTQTTVKYFYVVGVADTVLTVTGGSDYTVANAAITDIYVSKGNAVGFPASFNWTSHNMRGGSPYTLSGVVTEISRFEINGRVLTWWFGGYGTGGGSGYSVIVYDPPVKLTQPFATHLGHGRYWEGSTWNSIILWRGDSSSLIHSEKHSAGNWATSGQVGNRFLIQYLI